MGNYTLTYRKPRGEGERGGWPSFYSYLPEMVEGMNNFLYTFKGGNLWQHNANALRNNFYGVQYSSSIKFVVNDEAFDSKLFKAMAIEGTEAWDVTALTNKEDNAYIEREWFDEQEGSFHAFFRNSQTTPASTGEYALRSAQGIAQSASVSGPASATIVNFATNVRINQQLSVGDAIYHMPIGAPTPVYGGVVTNIEVDLPAGINRITIDSSVASATQPVAADQYYMFVKNSIAESNGVVGHYLEVTMTNDSTAEAVLFGVEFDLMRSYT